MTPRPASTVVLIREVESRLEVFLVRRHHEVAFMGGAHVFPGGRVEDSDREEGYVGLSVGSEHAAVRMPDDAADLARAFYVAAARETFEEAGLLLARDASGASVSFAAAADVAAVRARVERGEIRLLDVLQQHGWRLSLDAIEYFAHWVTPDIETRRFDTRFFLAAAPPSQTAAPDERETTAGVWLRPSDAIARCVAGAIALPPPTWTTLRWLEEFDRISAAMEWARHKVVRRIEPTFVQDGEAKLILLPGDRAVARVDGFDARETRFLLSDGRWTPV